MNIRHTPLIVLVLALLAGTAPPSTAQDNNTTTVAVEAAPAKPEPGSDEDPKALENDGWEAHELAFKAHDKTPFPFTTPGEGFWVDVPNGSGDVVLPFPNEGQDGIAGSFDKAYLLVDTNLDGKPDLALKSEMDALTVQLSLPGGVKQPYALRADKLRNNSYRLQRNGMAIGRFGKTRVTFIDDNSNGLWNDYGLDAVAVGETKYAVPMSTVLRLDGALYQVKINRAGTTFWTKPCDESTGTLDMQKNFKAHGELAWCVMQSGDMYLDLAGLKGGAEVPAGAWTLVAGELRRGKMSCRIRQGSMEPVTVAAGNVAAPAWGMDAIMDFTYDRSAGKMTLRAYDVKVFGAANEEYHSFKPGALSPRVQVRDKDTGKDVNRGTMCLS